MLTTEWTAAPCPLVPRNKRAIPYTSSTLFPSLRLGFILAPPGLVDIFRTVMSKFLQGVPTFSQAVVAEFIDEGHFASHIRRMRRIYAERHEALCDAAGARLGGLLDIVRTESGALISGRGKRSADGGKTWQEIKPFPDIFTQGWRHQMIALKNNCKPWMRELKR